MSTSAEAQVSFLCQGPSASLSPPLAFFPAFLSLFEEGVGAKRQHAAANKTASPPQSLTARRLKSQKYQATTAFSPLRSRMAGRPRLARQTFIIIEPQLLTRRPESL